MRKTNFALFGLASVGLALSQPSFAGHTNTRPVVVSFESMLAYGDLDTARHDPSPNMYIGCGVSTVAGTDGSIFEFGFCTAADADGTEVLCTTTVPELLDTMQHINDSSYISFQFEKIGGGYDCRAIGATSLSSYLP